MTKGFKSRLDRLDRQCAPQQVISVLDTPANRQLVADGFLPGDALPGRPEGADGCRRLRKPDVVLFLLEVEMGPDDLFGSKCTIRRLAVE